MTVEHAKAEVIKALILLKRITDDLDPDRFTVEELRAEGLEGACATGRGAQVDIHQGLAILTDLGYIERLRKGVYTVTQEGRDVEERRDDEDEY